MSSETEQGNVYNQDSLRAYKALSHAAEQIGKSNYRRGLYKKKGYSITPEHQMLVEAMPQVLAGEISVEEAMALLHLPEVERQRFFKG
jgi:hypothetical protein